jgi:predicted nucleic acid-binding protein
VKKPKLLDSFALMAFLGKESGFETVRALLREAEVSGQAVLMNEINVGEVYCLTAKGRSLEKADEFLLLLETLPVRVLGNTFPQVLEAARSAPASTSSGSNPQYSRKQPATNAGLEGWCQR